MIKECSDPETPIETCVVCGKSIHTCERKVTVNNSFVNGPFGTSEEAADHANRELGVIEYGTIVSTK